MNSSLPNRINLILFVITLLLTLMVKLDPAIWRGYGAPQDYLQQSKISLTSKDFYSPQWSENFYPRPFTVPLFYKIANSNPEIIIQLQKISVPKLCFYFYGIF